MDKKNKPRASATDSGFVPPWWLRNAHCQTLWQNLLRRAPQLATRRERLELADGDFIDLNWTLPALTPRAKTSTSPAAQPIIIVLHGLQGSVDSNYARGMLHAIQQIGARGVFMHFRGCSGESNRLARHYHAGETADLTELIAVLRRREPAAPLAAIGFSLGANVLLKYLGEQGNATPLQAAVAVSAPFDLSDSILRLNSGWFRLYERRFLRGLRRATRSKLGSGSHHQASLARLSALRSLREYDNAFTAPLHGFSDADDYYQRSSSRQYLRTIQIPTLILHAADDPFMTAQAIPRAEECSASVRLEVSLHGGHIGFVSGKYPWKMEYWAERRISSFLAKVLGMEG